jgi:hypothetical protein
MDANGDHRMQPEEKVAVSSVEGRTFRLANTTGALHMTRERRPLHPHDGQLRHRRFPAAGSRKAACRSGTPPAAYIAIPGIIPGMDKLYCTWRLGLVGMRRDSEGNFYAAVACSPPYATEAYTKYMHQGMGHTADVGAVFMTKYDPEGRLLWRVGRKAVGGMKPGEILHHWCYAGLLNDEYSVAASEWGVFTLYTKDGFYVDHLFDIPGIPGRGIPYSFGGEDFSGAHPLLPRAGRSVGVQRRAHLQGLRLHERDASTANGAPMAQSDSNA